MTRRSSPANLSSAEDNVLKKYLIRLISLAFAFFLINGLVRLFIFGLAGNPSTIFLVRQDASHRAVNAALLRGIF